ncbi:type II toxin-antitoxin system RelE family toxin [Campylobacter sputorum]|uniref:type II toxin-antitoxin system RelE family toxin n=1 Tax=Campylobacter sputorum TaxID=206 RepID=UPI000B786293|nr:type II toxin-antitoxin system RelE/ParE family toxin [Campylobacter sputorum subsp. sputorum]
MQNYKYEEKPLINQTIKRLKGDEYKDFYRLRLKSYRVFYKKEFDSLIILILRVDDRKDIYK